MNEVNITEKQKREIKQVKHFCDGEYAELDIRLTLKFYTKRYVQQIYDFISVGHHTIITDVGTGYGWMVMAFAFCTNARMIAIEPDISRLQAGKEIAKILGIENRVHWCIGCAENIPLHSKKSDVVYCIEVLEHTNKNPVAIHELCRISRNLIVLTTPNLWFPIIAHDTRLPFCHWLPLSMRDIYAKIFAKEETQYNNFFWSPYSFKKNMNEFKRISRWLHYSSYSSYLTTFPFYLPYKEFRHISKLGLLKKTFYRVVSLFGIYSHYFLPSLAGVFKNIEFKKRK